MEGKRKSNMIKQMVWACFAGGVKGELLPVERNPDTGKVDR